MFIAARLPPHRRADARPRSRRTPGQGCRRTPAGSRPRSPSRRSARSAGTRRGRRRRLRHRQPRRVPADLGDRRDGDRGRLPAGVRRHPCPGVRRDRGRASARRYGRIAFAAVGKYNEFENLRVAGVRYADLRGYSYDRADVSARALANAYAQTLGTVFTTESKPLEVELVVAEVGRTPDDDQIYRLSYDGSVADEHGHVVMGGQAEHLSERLSTQWRAGMGLADVVQVAVAVLGAQPDGEDRVLQPGQLEVAVLDRTRPRRAFRRLAAPQLSDLLGRDDVPEVDQAAPEGDGPPTEQG